MKDLEREIRHILRERLDPLSLSMPVGILPQARLRRLLLVAATTLGLLGIAGGILVASNLLRSPRPVQTGPATAAWAGLWPQDSLQEAEEAQNAADEGSETHVWQTALQGEEVALRYAREELGWTNPHRLDLRVPEGASNLVRWRIYECAPGNNTAYPEKDCIPPANGEYPAAAITLERLIHEKEGGLWFVTDIEHIAIIEATPPSTEEVRAFMTAFMEQRIVGSGAEEYVSPKGLEGFNGDGDLLPLYGSYRDFILVFLDGPLWPDGTYEVGVRIIDESGATLEDTLFVSPTESTDNEDDLLIRGGRPGLTGP